MMAGWSKVDLHLHTTASDGRLSPAELVTLALTRRLRYIALTDHDSTGGVEAAMASAHGTELEIIPGVELNTDVPEGEAHVLGYFIDWHDAALQVRLSGRRNDRLGRGAEMTRRLRALGLDLSWDRVQEIADVASGGAIGRPHLAQALQERRYVSSVQEAFEKYLGRGGPAYVAWPKVAPEEAVALVRRAGGVPALAHPTTLASFATRLPSLIEAGLLGLECYYGAYETPVVEQLVAHANHFGLTPTGGSDFHGPDVATGNVTLGGTLVPLSVISGLKGTHAAVGGEKAPR